MGGNVIAPSPSVSGRYATGRNWACSCRECAPERGVDPGEPPVRNGQPSRSAAFIHRLTSSHSLPHPLHGNVIINTQIPLPQAHNIYQAPHTLFPSSTTTQMTLNPAAPPFTPSWSTGTPQTVPLAHRRGGGWVGGGGPPRGPRSSTDFPLLESRPAARSHPHERVAANDAPPDASQFFRPESSSSRPSRPSRASPREPDMAAGRASDQVPWDLDRVLDSCRYVEVDRRTLKERGAVTVIRYNNRNPDPQANDIWPEFRSASRLPAQYSLLQKVIPGPEKPPSAKRRNPKICKKEANQKNQADMAGRPKWNLPVELIEIIAGYLDRDDIKSLRMVSHELESKVSQVIFQTVVVPFNTEIYGMLAQGQKPDLKGKKRAGLDGPGYLWRNSNGDEVYNGHGLDVFKGFGHHIVRYGMSFEVSEDSLAQPPVKSVTEKKTSFWGNYEWPFADYRRFDAIAGLEIAADETPRMKLAFSELTKVQELALSVDSGLGWLNGPDRSIRARILRKPPTVFGTLKQVPDRRAQAQRELWRHIETYHQLAGEDVKLAILYQLDDVQLLSEAAKAWSLAEEQPIMPYLDTQMIHEATPYGAPITPTPITLEDPEMLHRFVLAPSSANSGILLTSTSQPPGGSQLRSPVIPASLTNAQKEWLLETEWAQRAFISSYMLSIIDNPATFAPIHTLNISRLSDRYLAMLDRTDFWAALPNLRVLTLLVVPGWRNVSKDEAGFVKTPRINPLNGLDPFLNLLSKHVATRPGIRNLTLGWIGGGEHAEGLFARNRLLMPAPIMPMTFSNNTFTSYHMISETSPDRLQAALLSFPYVEKLVLKNCWTAPDALLQFIKIHDALPLKHLVMDSVSLKAALPAQGDGNGLQPAPPFTAPLVQIPPAPQHFVIGGAGLARDNSVADQTAYQTQPLPDNDEIFGWIFASLQVHQQNIQALQQGHTNPQQLIVLGILSGQVQTYLHQLPQLQVQHLELEEQQKQVLDSAQNQQQALDLAQNQSQAPDQASTQEQAESQVQYRQQVNHYNQNMSQLHANIASMYHQLRTIQQHLIAAASTSSSSTTSQSLLDRQPRQGSWTWLIDQISPGTNLSHFGSSHSLANPARTTSLTTLTFVSCGYAGLSHVPIEYVGIDLPHQFLDLPLRKLRLYKRYNSLFVAMLPSKWDFLGEIMPNADTPELDVLDAVWGLKEGIDWDEEEAQAAEFDGCARGGTGRFGGVVRKGDEVVVGK